MNANTRIRVILHCSDAGTELYRTLTSLSLQSIGSSRFSVTLASTAPDGLEGKEARLLHEALDFRSLDVLDARRMPPAQALNVAALRGGEPWLLLAPVGTRLSPKFAERCLAEATSAQVQACHCLHTAGSAESEPLTLVRPFNAEQLVRSNSVGPVALVRREAWERLGGLRPTMQLVLWDFWLRLALSGGQMLRVPELLACCPALTRLSPWQDGQAKALLVVGTPGAFEPDVCRWAMALLRGEGWAKPFEPGRIPGPRDVQAMFAGMAAPCRPEHAAWNARPRCLAQPVV